MITDYINGDKFRDLCDFDFEKPQFVSGKKKYILYADSNKYVNALSFISQHRDKRFVLVTDNGAPEIRKTGIPFNVIRWFAMNPNFKHPKISPIPLGLERPKWHPTKMQIMLEAENTKRLDKAFCQFNPGTKPDARTELLVKASQRLIDADVFSCVNGQNFEGYIQNLKKYKYCFSPRGRGIDTHRTWEALYMGCIPITQKEFIHEFEDFDLPILFLDNWEDFNYQEVKGDFNSKLLTMSYWEKLIKGSLDEK